uniref:F-box domain-containing protein n=1 Tax=Ananas comosus var. bracteatus TaxID=296719 RepID=A0A6V7NVZ8_ANACO|nr:unnamed protein product [Ananas comosus var. bracteatus]
MREGDSSCMVSRALPSSYDRESMRAYAGEEEEDRAEEPHPINGVLSKKKKTTKKKKKKKKKKMVMVVDSPLYGCGGEGEGEGEHEHEDPDSLISPVIGRDLSINCLLHLSCSDYGAVASLNRSFRSLLQSGELYRLRRRSGAVEHWVFFSCNVLEWDAFDPFRRRWISAAVPKMPPLECFMFCDKESLAVATDLLVFGKDMTSCIVLRYSILTNSWSKGVAMHSPAACSAPPAPAPPPSSPEGSTPAAGS